MSKRPQYLRVLMMFSFNLFGLFGCGGSSVPNEDELNWKHVDSALRAENVNTIRELFLRLSEAHINTNTVSYFKNAGTRETEFDSLEVYIKQNFEQPTDHKTAETQGIDMSRAAILKRLSNDLTWKTAERSLDNVTRVYAIDSHYPTKAEDIVQWGRKIYFKVFTDDKGGIVGWQNSKVQAGQ